MKSATFGSSAPFYFAISWPGNSVNSAQIWSHSSVSSSKYLGSSPSFGPRTHSCAPGLSSKSVSSVTFNQPLHFKCFTLSTDKKTESLLHFNNCRAPCSTHAVRSLLVLLQKPATTAKTDSSQLYYSLYPLSLVPLYVHIRISGQSVSPDTFADVLDVNMFCSRESSLWIEFPVDPSADHLHVLCSTVGLLPVFINVSPNGCHSSRLWDDPSFSVISWRIVNYLIVDLECSKKAQEAMRLKMYCRCCCMFLIVFL